MDSVTSGEALSDTPAVAPAVPLPHPGSSTESVDVRSPSTEGQAPGSGTQVPAAVGGTTDEPQPQPQRQVPASRAPRPPQPRTPDRRPQPQSSSGSAPGPQHRAARLMPPAERGESQARGAGGRHRPGRRLVLRSGRDGSVDGPEREQEPGEAAQGVEAGGAASPGARGGFKSMTPKGDSSTRRRVVSQDWALPSDRQGQGQARGERTHHAAGSGSRHQPPSPGAARHLRGIGMQGPVARQPLRAWDDDDDDAPSSHGEGAAAAAAAVPLTDEQPAGVPPLPIGPWAAPEDASAGMGGGERAVHSARAQGHGHARGWSGESHGSGESGPRSARARRSQGYGQGQGQGQGGRARRRKGSPRAGALLAGPWAGVSRKVVVPKPGHQGGYGYVRSSGYGQGQGRKG